MILDFGIAAVIALACGVIAVGSGREAKHVLFAASGAAVLSLAALSIFPVLGQVTAAAWVHTGWLWLSLASGLVLLAPAVAGGHWLWRSIMLLCGVGTLSLSYFVGAPLLADALAGAGYAETQRHANLLSPIVFGVQSFLIGASVVEMARLRVTRPRERDGTEAASGTRGK